MKEKAKKEEKLRPFRKNLLVSRPKLPNKPHSFAINKDTEVSKKFYYCIFFGFFILVFSFFLKEEINSSKIQSAIFHKFSSLLSFQIHSGKSELIYFPEHGPYDERLAYSKIKNYEKTLKEKGFTISSQANISNFQNSIYELGIFPIYTEKAKAGLKILDSQETKLFETKYPYETYNSFKEIPEIIYKTLLFIEDKDLLQDKEETFNPVVNYVRFFKAISDIFISKFFPNHEVHGGSTLITQMEKFRHSKNGVTNGTKDKLRQMFSAMLRVYQYGRKTDSTRKKIVLDYINSVPLAAVRNYGEVTGLGDGLRAYFGTDLKEVNQYLSSNYNPVDVTENLKKASYFKQVLTLFLAHRRPSELLRGKKDKLKVQVDNYLKLLFHEKIITRELYENCLLVNPLIKPTVRLKNTDYLSKKASNLVRTNLLSLLNERSFYELDRFDLEVSTNINSQSQSNITEKLRSLKDLEFLKSNSLLGYRLLNEKNPLEKMIVSFTLYEKKENYNVLRVQTDNLDQPFDINQGVKIDLGSTAKFRTLVTYLEVMHEIYQKYSILSKSEKIKKLEIVADKLSKWGINQLIRKENLSLDDFLNLSMERKYSANPWEKFFTAGGLHNFKNFNANDNGKIVSVKKAIRHSVNLPFIRIMRDLVNYFSYEVTGSTARTLKKMEKVKRTEYLKRFADKEGKIFINKFYKKYRYSNKNEIFEKLFENRTKSAKKAACLFLSLIPNVSQKDLITFIENKFPKSKISSKLIESWYIDFNPNKLSLLDRAFVARIHPLELWTVHYLYNNKNRDLSNLYSASNEIRQYVYSWLINSKYKSSQNSKIKTILEEEAFLEIHKYWKKVGYPYARLVPSLATSLGTSADKPAALSTLLGIIVNDGKKLPMQSVNKLNFATGTPYETNFKFIAKEAEQVIPKAVAKKVKEALFDVVQNGTALRLKNGIQTKNKNFSVGGKTGTGDNRFKIFNKSGVLTKSIAVNRTATFAFIIGERFFGNITVYVPGDVADEFSFTSALPVRLLKVFEKDLESVLN